MNRKDLYQSCINIDDDILERSENAGKRKISAWVKWGVIAACLCIVFVSAYMVQDLWKKPEPIISEPGITDTIVLSPDGTNQQEDESVEQVPVDVVDEQLNPGQLIFNDAASFLSASRKYIPGYFTEELDDKDILAIKPDRRIPDMCFSGVAGYDGEGTLLEIFLRIEAPILDDVVHVTFNNGSRSSCYEPLEEPIISTYNGMDYTIYQWTPDGSNYTLGAYAEIDGWSMQIAYTATAETLEKAKTDFATIILCMHYVDGKPDFSSIVAENIPEYYDKPLSLSEACNDPDFGSFMIQELPEGFVEESIRRYKDQNNDYLSGLWTKGLANLSWKISVYDEDDAARCTSVAKTENYNLALYPIPRAESVPEELREIVDNPIFDATELTLEAVYMRAYKVEDAGDIDGWRMVFSVQYGDVIVEIRTKGVEPEWVYEQLQMISKYSE